MKLTSAAERHLAAAQEFASMLMKMRAESVAGVAAAPSLASTVPCSVVDGVGGGVVNGE